MFTGLLREREGAGGGQREGREEKAEEEGSREGIWVVCWHKESHSGLVVEIQVPRMAHSEHCCVLGLCWENERSEDSNGGTQWVSPNKLWGSRSCFCLSAWSSSLFPLGLVDSSLRWWSRVTTEGDYPLAHGRKTELYKLGKPYDRVGHL